MKLTNKKPLDIKWTFEKNLKLIAERNKILEKTTNYSTVLAKKHNTSPSAIRVQLFELSKDPKYRKLFLYRPRTVNEYKDEKIGVLDIEGGGRANWSYIVCYCIKELNGKIIANWVTPKEIFNYTFDKRLMQDFCKDIRRFDRIVVYWGSDARYDIPTLRTRAVKYDLDFPLYKEALVTDLFSIIAQKFRLDRKSLESACKFFGIPCKETNLTPDMTQKSRAGHLPSILKIVKHCKEDVTSTEALYKKIIYFGSSQRRSI